MTSPPSSRTSPSDEIRRWVETWDRAAAALAEQRRAELLSRTDDDFLRECLMLDQHFRSLDLSAFPPRPCGMVEMQRIFKPIAGRS